MFPRHRHPHRGAALCPALGLALALACGQAAAFPLTFDLPATVTGAQSEPLASLALPVGPWQDGRIDAIPTEGQISRSAWQLDGAQPTLATMAGLRAQLAAAGYETLYECETLGCGGFDFRFGIDILPEPEMHVDLGDFRFLSARRIGPQGPEYLSMIVSRSATKGFVQLTSVGPKSLTAPMIAASTMSAPADGTVPPVDLPLAENGQLVLEDLIFAPGTATLEDRAYPSLEQLARWLDQNPDAVIELVGHTDSQGSAAGNVALSQQRADAVRQALIDNADIAPARITTRGAGPSEPRADNATAEGRQKNRRVEVIFTPTR